MWTDDRLTAQETKAVEEPNRTGARALALAGFADLSSDNQNDPTGRSVVTFPITFTVTAQTAVAGP